MANKIVKFIRYLLGGILNKDYRNVQKFIGMMLGGCIISVLVGTLIDRAFRTGPLVFIGLLLYTVIGSLVWLIKSVGGNK